MTIKAHLVIKQDSEMLVEQAKKLEKEAGSGIALVFLLLDWLEQQGRDADDVL